MTGITDRAHFLTIRSGVEARHRMNRLAERGQEGGIQISTDQVGWILAGLALLAVTVGVITNVVTEKTDIIDNTPIAR